MFLSDSSNTKRLSSELRARAEVGNNHVPMAGENDPPRDAERTRAYPQPSALHPVHLLHARGYVWIM